MNIVIKWKRIFASPVKSAFKACRFSSSTTNMPSLGRNRSTRFVKCCSKFGKKNKSIEEKDWFTVSRSRSEVIRFGFKRDAHQADGKGNRRSENEPRK